MSLTAFSKATGEELDVDHVIRRLAGNKEANTTALLLAGIPDAWRQVIREDMECPSCFTLGADLVYTLKCDSIKESLAKIGDMDEHADGRGKQRRQTRVENL
jgi:hypothetical protein